MKNITTIGSLIIFLFILSWVGSEIYHAKTSNANDITTYKEYVEDLPSPISARLVISAGQNYVVLYGPIKSPLTIPSGPPAYIFDLSGQLVDWSGDIGDDLKFYNKWALGEGREILVEDVDTQFIEKNQIEQVAAPDGE